MSTDHTQHQTPDEQVRARDLSLRGTRPPAELADYEAERLIGEGAFGEVWIGRDRNTGRRVAIKFYTQRSRLDWTLLSREVEKLVFLSADRYVVQLLDVGWNAEPPYYVMEFVEGGSLQDLLREQGRLPPRDAVEMFREIATGLMHAHGKGVLHCDLKPANILLDQDLRPRLADFGQSRLSHEQTPALGTLFYMAPEQADLEAVPDARWDVYALGALLFCMLTGAAPHREEGLIQTLDEADGLPEKLLAYRRALKKAAPPTAHRKIPGVDRALADIVDRCLARDPERRFPNTQSILDALRRRDDARVRNPLLFLGFVGPILLLLIVALFGVRGYGGALAKSKALSSRATQKQNEFAAKVAAYSIEAEIYRYFNAIRDEADEPQLLKLLEPVANSQIVRELNAKNRAGEKIDALRDQFATLPDRLALNALLDERLEAYLVESKDDNRALMMSSMFAIDRNGRMLAAAYNHDLPSRSIGWCFGHRTYFNGQPADLEYDNDVEALQQMPPPGTEPIRTSHFSSAFLSTTSNTWKVAVSTPIFREDEVNGTTQKEVIGVLALTINLGDLTHFRNEATRNGATQSPATVLIDGRQGVILQHPLFKSGPVIDEYHVSAEQLAALRAHVPGYVYQDPLAAAPGGEAFGGNWIAAVWEAELPNASADQDHADMIVLVQSQESEAFGAVETLGETLKQEGFWALGGVIAVILVLWYIVFRMLHEPQAVFQRRANGFALPTTTQQPTTVRSTERS